MAAARSTAAGPLRRAPLLLLLGLLLVAACEAELILDLTVTARGAGELRLELAADDALVGAAAAAGVDPLEELAAAGGALAEDGWSVSERALEDGGRAVTLAAPFEDPDAFDALAAALADALAAPEVALVERLTLHVDEEVVRLEGAVSAEPGPAVADYGVEPDEAAEQLAAHDAFRLRVRARLPGAVIETTAPDTSPPLEWTVEPGERADILAVAELPVPWWRQPAVLAWAGLGLVLTGAVVAAVGLAWRARPRRALTPGRGSSWRSGRRRGR